MYSVIFVPRSSVHMHAVLMGCAHGGCGGSGDP